MVRALGQFHLCSHLQHLHHNPWPAERKIRSSGTQSMWKLRPKNVPQYQYPNAQQNTKTNADLSRDNSVKLLINKNVIHNTSSSVAQNTKMNWSIIQRQNVKQTTRRIVSISGREQETTRFGLQFQAPATTTPMIAAVMFRNRI